MKLRFHVLLLVFVAVGIGLLFLDEPKFGDDFTYWYHALNLHERGMDAWSDKSFHQIRWPVWGVCWVLQAVFGPGLISYYGTPYLYLTLGALAAFAVGWTLFRRAGLAWAVALAFLFHPLLDTLVARPMPDLGEGVFGAFAVLAWWGLMQAESRGRMLLHGAAAGAAIFFAEENRLTGVFLIPLLGCLTLLFFPRKILRLSAVGGVFAILLAAQMAFYHAQFGDWLHFLHANEGAKGKKGTEAVTALWSLPFRFLDTLGKGSPLAPFYAIFAACGLWFGWRRNGLFGRVVVAWFALLYLAYACAPQQLWPFRPLLRDADRFLAALAIPYGAVAVLGLADLLELAGQSARWRKLPAALARKPLVTGVAATTLLVALSAKPLGDRGFFTLSYVHEFRDYLRALPTGTRVFTHHHMRALARMMDDSAVQRLQWVAADKWILERTPELEAAAARSDEFWYVRKLSFLDQSKTIEKGKVTKQPALGSYFDATEKDWRLARVLTKDDTPDIVLYSRRRPDTPAAIVFEAGGPELAGLLPALPVEWKRNQPKGPIEREWSIPPVLRGKLVRLEMEGASEERDAIELKVAFVVGGKTQPEYSLRPLFFKDGGKDFLALPIPGEADACKLRVFLDKKAQWARMTKFRLVADAPK